ncbi:hypothetical protein PSACC_00614 [Paramicrosporidium saccamoebae]|uniref:Diacylglycerol O-acyltransferase n=1 Tax=Paramicrosporidium saccamoebae TaxID=1246581 RepID=A0A2H9TPI9_9FUNG|nr:hypothetical protein PSACC_00614 [Paramicrosporidium saccamoebae]
MQAGSCSMLSGLVWLSFLGLLLASASLTAGILWLSVFGEGGMGWLCRVVSLVYAVWLFYDWDTPSNGVGRRSPLVISIMQPVFTYAKSCFSSEIIYDCDLSKLRRDQPLMLGCHPHGICSFAVLSNFSLTGGTILRKHPVSILTLQLQFMVPLWRELVIALGFASVSYPSVEARLRAKGDIAIVIGGARESLDSRPGHIELTLRHRTGFFKLALKHGATILPVLSFGEVDIYHQIRRPWIKKIQIALMQWMTIAIPLFYSRLWLIPDSTRLTSVVGSPITVEKAIENPTPEDVKKLQDQYISALLSIHQKYNAIVPHGKCSLTIK